MEFVCGSYSNCSLGFYTKVYRKKSIVIGAIASRCYFKKHAPFFCEIETYLSRVNHPRVSIVILNWNGKHFLEKFLPSVLLHSNYEWVNVVVADNASTDDSVRFLLTKYPQVSQVVLKENTGYAGGYQAALQQIQADYYVLLNSDIEVTKNWLLPVIELMESNKNIAAAQPKIRDFNSRQKFEYAGAAGGEIDCLGYPFCRGRIFDTVETDAGQYNTDAKIFWTTGACMFVRSSAFWQAGGLDSDFFAHQEEIDLCWRLQRLGHEVWYCGSSVIYHVGGGTLSYANPRKTYLNFRNNLWLLTKNLPLLQLLWVIPARLVLDGVAALQLSLKYKDLKDLNAILKAHFAFYASLPSMATKRKNFDAPYTLPSSVFSKSILIQYFLLKRRKYSDVK
jgi:GT2 family glycosyltransferase